MNALQTLLADVVDYAGLFPPAALSMASAARNYAAYRAGEHAWMLGAFVVPATRLRELATVRAEAAPNGGAWPLAVLVDDAAAGADSLAAASASGAGTVAIVELKARDGDDLARATHALDAAGIAVSRAFAEVPWSADFASMADAARRAGCGLKLRTGGVVAGAFPSPDVVLRFMSACAERRVPFKLTAGLHHPLHGEQPLTYEPGCARGTMYGFLDMLVAAALLGAGHEPSRVAPVLEERDAAAFRFGDDGVEVRGMHVTAAGLARGQRGLRSFGSCSFEEPVADLRALGLLPPSPLSLATTLDP